MKNEELRMKKLLKKTLKLILPIVLGGFILYWVYRDFDFSRVGEVLRHGTNWWWMLFSLLFGVLAQVFRGWRWRQTLEPLDAFPRRSDCVNAIFISYAASLVVPRIGEVSRCGVLAKYDNVSFAKSLGTVVTERLVDTLTIFLITGITVLLQMPVFVTFLENTGTKIPSFAYLLTSVWFYIVLFCFIGVVVLLYYLRKTLFFYERVKGFVLNIWEGIMSLKGVRNIPLFIFYTLAIWACYFFHFYFIAVFFRQTVVVWHDQLSVDVDNRSFFGKIQWNDRNIFQTDILPDVQFGPVAQREYTNTFSFTDTGIVYVPKFRTLVFGIPLVKFVTEGEDTFFGT